MRASLRYGFMAVAAIVAIAGATAWKLRPPPPPSYDTAAVEQGNVAAKVTATGTLQARVTVQVGSQVSGRLSELDADYNSPVVKDEVIARLDPELFQAALAQAQANDAAAHANLTRARVQATDAQRQADRAKALADRQLLSAQDSDTAQTAAAAAAAAVEAAEAGVQQAAAALHSAQVNLGNTTIHAPISGVVISRNVELGQTVAASLSAPVLYVIAEDLAKMQVHTSIAEADIGRLADVKTATFTVDAWPGRSFTGTVFQVRNSPTTVQNVVTYDVVIDVDNADLALKPGMTANVTFVWAQHDDVLRVPNTALRYHPADAKPARGGDPQARTLYVLRDKAAVPVPVTVGLTDGTSTEVAADALHVGDLVVTDSDDSGGKGGGGGGGAFRRGL